ncbi:MAG: AAA family ATPase [Oscillospiraceae bacterium]|nr:AAA family ATPase [Oscillospiraceae bacterium]
MRNKIIIADENAEYIMPLQLKFIKEFWNKIDLEIITDRQYLQELFLKPQSIRILIISEELYSPTFERHDIENIFILTENKESMDDVEGNVRRIFKYSSVQKIFNDTTCDSWVELSKGDTSSKKSKIIVVTSAKGGVGKTTIALSLCNCLAQDYKSVLYINAERLQSFQYLLHDGSPISSIEVYQKLSAHSKHVYEDIRQSIRTETFSYLPAFKADLNSLSIDFSVFAEIVTEAKNSGEYDYIVVDTESSFGVSKIRLLDLCDKAIVVTDQTRGSLFATNTMVSNISGINSEKYLFICNRYDSNRNVEVGDENVRLKFLINGYIGYIDLYGKQESDIKTFSKNDALQKIMYSII